MAKPYPSLTGDLKQISECWLYRDPRVSHRARLHTFCRECKESSTITKDDSCPLCRPFFKIPEDGSGSIPRNVFMEKLVDLHEAHLERQLKLTDEKIIDIPLVEQFKIEDASSEIPYVAWLENELYVITWPKTSIHVFSDRAPFEKLEEKTINIKDMRQAVSMTASAATSSIFVGDRRNNCIFRIQMPGKEVSRCDVDGIPSDLSITGNGELLVGVSCSNWQTTWDIPGPGHLKIVDLTDSTYIVIPLPIEIGEITSVVQSPNQNFIISYKSPTEAGFWVSILSRDGQKLIKTVDTSIYNSILTASSSISRPKKYSRLAVKDDGQIFATDQFGTSVLLLNSDLTGCRVLSNNGQIFETWTSIVYVREKQQLFVPGIEWFYLVHVYDPVISVFHLSPCYNNIIA